MARTIIAILAVLATILPARSTDNTVSSEQSPSPVMVIPGRTWWYHAQRQPHSARPANNYEFGIQISNERFEAYGKIWYMAQITHSAIFDPDGNNPVYDDTIYPVCPIREENGRVYVWTVPRYDYHCGFEAVEEWMAHSSCWYFCFDNQEQFPCEAAIYDFNENGETVTIGTQAEPLTSRIIERRTIESHGFSYNERREYSDIRFSHEYFLVEGIGTYDEYNDLEFFLTPCPSDFSAPGTIVYPILRYVTDRDGEIIYERHGGMRLWDDMKSTVSIETPASETSVEWFNLQGVSIPRPTAPGIYIRKEGRNVSKVSIR